MLKKILISAVFVATAVSPVLPKALADAGSWKTTIGSDAWDYDYYHVERLVSDQISGPYQFNQTLFTTKRSSDCAFADSCDLVDLTLFQDGQSLTINHVDEQVTDLFRQTAQDGRFIYFVPSETDKQWGTVYEYDPSTKAVNKLVQLERPSSGVSFMTFATDGDRVYSSTLNKDEKTGDIESQLSVIDTVSGYARQDFTYTLTAPWQEIEDVHEGLALVTFEFEGGFKQLWLVNQTARSMQALPETWTQPDADIIGAHFLSDGSIRFFRNFRLWKFNPNTDKAPTDAGGATLSWLVDLKDAVSISGDRMAYVDSENNLYLSDLEGVHKFGTTMNGVFHLNEETLSFQNKEGDYREYTFSTNSWLTRSYQVTDRYEDVLVGLDQKGNIWYENTTTKHLLHIGYGAAPVLADREHAYWTGADNRLYEATFSPLLDLERNDLEAYRAYGSSTVYAVDQGNLWTVPDEMIYFTWFDSWDDVTDVSQATIDVYLETYTDKGDLKMAPGTRVKATSSKKVYVVGSDYKLHWITSETVAHDIYGSDWNKGIISVKDTSLWKYATGSNVSSSNDVKSI